MLSHRGCNLHASPAYALAEKLPKSILSAILGLAAVTAAPGDAATARCFFACSSRMATSIRDRVSVEKFATEARNASADRLASAVRAACATADSSAPTFDGGPSAATLMPAGRRPWVGVGPGRGRQQERLGTGGERACRGVHRG